MSVQPKNIRINLGRSMTREYQPLLDAVSGSETTTTAQQLTAFLGVPLDQQNPRLLRGRGDVVVQKRFGRIDISAMSVRHFLKVGVKCIVANTW